MKTKSLELRRKPEQSRSIERTRQIMDVTAKLLGEVGFDKLTTILIAKELNISVGSLYHYYPNKHAILRALAERWLEAWNLVLEQIEALPLETMSLDEIIPKMTVLFSKLYREQKAVLPLVQAMFIVPEIRDLDDQHDEKVVIFLSHLCKRIGIKKSNKERQRIGRSYLEIIHAMMLMNTEESGVRSARTLKDLNVVTISLLQHHR